MKTCFPKARSRLERAFIAWYREHENDFQRPLLLVRRTDDDLLFTMPGLNPALSILLHSWEFGVYAEWQGQDWDLLMSYSASPEHTDNGYYDRFT